MVKEAYLSVNNNVTKNKVYICYSTMKKLFKNGMPIENVLSKKSKYAYPIMKEALENGLDPNVRDVSDYKSMSPLHMVIGCSKMAELLIEYGANVNSVEFSWRTHTFTPLIGVAIHNKCMPVVKLLLENGADINMPDSNGWLPLDQILLCTTTVYPQDSLFYKSLLELGAKHSEKGLTITHKIDKLIKRIGECLIAKAVE